MEKAGSERCCVLMLKLNTLKRYKKASSGCTNVERVDSGPLSLSISHFCLIESFAEMTT